MRLAISSVCLVLLAAFATFASTAHAQGMGASLDVPQPAPPEIVLPALGPPSQQIEPMHLGNLYGRAWSASAFGGLIGVFAGILVGVPIAVATGPLLTAVVFAISSVVGTATGFVLGAGYGVWHHGEESGVEGDPAIANLGTWLGPIVGALLGALFTLPFGGNTWLVGLSAGALGGAVVFSQLGAILSYALTRSAAL